MFTTKEDLVYLDSAATSQKPKQVLDAMTNYYENYNANVRRGIYPIAEKATKRVEEVRTKAAAFINAKSKDEIIFVRNATEAINIVAQSFASHNIKRGESIVTTISEHHSNFVPWQQLSKHKNAPFVVIDINNNFQLQIDFSIFRTVKILAIGHVSNVLGTLHPIADIVRGAKKINPDLVVVLDAAQSVPHMSVDVQELGVDFMAFSGHKMMASMGIGVLYGKKKILDQMPPFLLGSDMIKEVTIEDTVFDDPPGKFEAGTPDVAGIISLGAAIDYLETIGMENVRKHEQKLVTYCLSLISKIDGLTIYGPKEAEKRGGVISFTMKGVHSHDIAQILGDMGVCIRAGHHCAMPLHKRLSLTATARVSFYVYNDENDVNRFIGGLKKVKEVFKI